MTLKLRFGHRTIKKSNKPKAYLVDRLYIPKHLVDMRRARKYYDRRLYDQKRCNNCPVYKDGERFSDLCAPCEHYKGRFTTFEETEISGEEFVAFPAGSIEAVAKNLGIELTQFEIQDNRCDARVLNPLTFTGKLFTGKEIINGFATANQVDIIRQFAPHKRGLIESPTRSGKTVVATYIYCGAKRRTLYLVHEKQLAKQFYRTLLKFTDLREKREKTGKKIVGIIEKESDWAEDWDCVICNYQKFFRETGFERILKYIIRRFGQVIIDETHRAASMGYVKLINQIDAKRKIGMSATLTRKDGMQFLMHQILGEIVAKGEVITKPPYVEIIETGVKSTKRWGGRAGYTYANKWLFDQRDRTKLIIKNVFARLRENPDNSIIIPVLFKAQSDKIARMINAQAQFNNDFKGENWPLILAHPYHDHKSINRPEVLDKARSGEIRVVVAYYTMIREGIDVPKWNTMLLIYPFNNEENFYQMTSRILNNYVGKPQPLLQMYVDGTTLSTRCFRSMYFNGVLKCKYLVDDENKEIAEKIIEEVDGGSRKKVENIDGW